jgi:tetratricopeptide (TPR) repeat protein
MVSHLLRIALLMNLVGVVALAQTEPPPETCCGKTCVVPSTFSTAAILIGISNYSNDDVKSVKMASRDVKLLAQPFCDSFDYVRVLTDGDATSATVRQSIEDVLAAAQESSQVVIFISARGIDDVLNGYIMTFESPITHLNKATAILDSDLLELINNSRVQADSDGGVYLFVDLCRSPAEYEGKKKEGKKNHVHKRLRTEFKAARKSDLILASRESQRSKDLKDQSVFAYYLRQGLAGAAGSGEIKPADLYQYVLTEVKNRTAGAQEPNRLESPPELHALPVVSSGLQVEHFEDRYLLAFQRPAGLPAEQTALATAAQAAVEIASKEARSGSTDDDVGERRLEALKKAGPKLSEADWGQLNQSLTDADSALSELNFEQWDVAAKSLKSITQFLRSQDLPGVSQMEDLILGTTIAKAVVAEVAGQRVFVRYGEGNHLPGDPFRQCADSGGGSGSKNKDAKAKEFQLCPEQYEQAAEYFEVAAEARRIELQDADTVEGKRRVCALIQSLDERSRFCRGKALIGLNRFKDALETLSCPAARSDKTDECGCAMLMAESFNARGIALLELSDFEAAKGEFGEAIDRSPGWPYPRHNLALTEIEDGQYSDGEREYQAAIQYTPIAERVEEGKSVCFEGRSLTVVSRPYLYYNLGVLLHRLNRKRDAQRQYCLAEESFQQQIKHFETRAKELRGDAKLEGLVMRAELRKKAAETNLADVHNSLGAVLHARGKTTRARAQYRLAIDENPGLHQASYNLAVLDREENPENPDVAKTTMGEIHGYLPARFKLAEWALEDKDYKTAAQIYQEICCQDGISDSQRAAADRGLKRVPEASRDMSRGEGYSCQSQPD